MDRFKFRVWDKNLKQMKYDAENTYDYMQGLGACFGDVIQNPDFIVEQCTGLKDKNGNLIYEGDIVRCTLGPIWVDLTVVYDDKVPGFSGKDQGGGLYSIVPKNDNNILEIIGNIHDKEQK